METVLLKYVRIFPVDIEVDEVNIPLVAVIFPAGIVIAGQACPIDEPELEILPVKTGTVGHRDHDLAGIGAVAVIELLERHALGAPHFLPFEFRYPD